MDFEKIKKDFINSSIRFLTGFFVFLFVLYVLGFIALPNKHADLHSVAKQAAMEKHDKAMQNKKSMLYKYNSEKFQEDIYEIAKTEAEKGEFYIEFNEGFKISNGKILTTTDKTKKDYYWPEEAYNYLEDSTINILKFQGIKINADNPDFTKLNW